MIRIIQQQQQQLRIYPIIETIISIAKWYHDPSVPDRTVITIESVLLPVLLVVVEISIMASLPKINSCWETTTTTTTITIVILTLTTLRTMMMMISPLKI